MPLKFTADGQDVNPELIITNIPDEAKSIILIVEDPDAKKVAGFTWIHWLVFDIPVKSNEVIIKEDSVPGVYGESTYKKAEYGGPNPPKGSGIHHYHFKIYAINKMLGLEEGTSLSIIKKEMQRQVIEECELIGIYSRDK